MTEILNRETYALSDAALEHIFRTRIVPDIVLTNPLMAPQTSPLAAITGGQPGSGKSKLIEALEIYRFKSSALTISGDDLRHYHPEHERLLHDDPLNAAFYTDRDSGRWVEMLIDWVSKEVRVNIIIESTMRNPETFRITAKLLRERGYRVEAHAIAVHPALSWLGVNLRYEEGLQSSGSARYTIRASHDAGVAGVPKTLAAIHDERLADEITVHSRSHDVLYNNQLEPGGSGWKSPEPPETIFEQLFAADPSPLDAEEIAKGWERATVLMRRRGAPEAEIKRLLEDAAQ